MRQWSIPPSHARVYFGNEHGLQRRFQQEIGQEFGAALQANSVELQFADFKCSGSSYKNPSDLLALSEDSGVANVKIVGELKVPWVEEHSLDAADENDHPRLAVKLALPIRDMQLLGCEYGFISTYDETVFLRQYQSPGGTWEVWYCLVVRSSNYYIPTPQPPQGTGISLAQVSMKQTMFYVCSLASTADELVNKTNDWVNIA